jgi:hypothetical protein
VSNPLGGGSAIQTTVWEPQLTLFGQLFAQDGLGNALAFLPGFKDGGGSDQNSGGQIRGRDGFYAQDDAVGQPEENAKKIEGKRRVGKVAATLTIDLDDLGDEGKGGRTRR